MNARKRKHISSEPSSDIDDVDSVIADDDETATDEYNDQFLHDSPESLRTVHQCTVCDKILLTFRGLQQHSLIHVSARQFPCDICGKEFRFRSNLYEHSSVHSGFVPYSCNFCGKLCRLKGNLKKHMKTHVSSKEDLETAWKSLKSNRRQPKEIADDAVVVRGTGDPFRVTPNRHKRRMKKLSLGHDPSEWIEKIKLGELMPAIKIDVKIHRLEVFLSHCSSSEEVFRLAKGIPFERFDCPICRAVFLTNLECQRHFSTMHPLAKENTKHFCEVCMKSFANLPSLELHQSYHKRVFMMLTRREIDIPEPVILIPDDTIEYGHSQKDIPQSREESSSDSDSSSSMSQSMHSQEIEEEVDGIITQSDKDRENIRYRRVESDVVHEVEVYEMNRKEEEGVVEQSK